MFTDPVIEPTTAVTEQHYALVSGICSSFPSPLKIYSESFEFYPSRRLSLLFDPNRAL